MSQFKNSVWPRGWSMWSEIVPRHLECLRTLDFVYDRINFSITREDAMCPLFSKHMLICLLPVKPCLSLSVSSITISWIRSRNLFTILDDASHAFSEILDYFRVRSCISPFLEVISVTELMAGAGAVRMFELQRLRLYYTQRSSRARMLASRRTHERLLQHPFGMTAFAGNWSTSKVQIQKFYLQM